MEKKRRVIVHLSGGFGNQLFSYAFGYCVAKRRCAPLWIDTAIQDEKWFFRNPDILKLQITYDRRLSYPIRRDILSRAVLNRLCFRHAIGLNTSELKEEELTGTPEEILRYCQEYAAPSLYLRGNWQREAFFAECADEIRKRFRLALPLPEKLVLLKKELEANPASVGIHYRRGDYVQIGACPAPDYFCRAMETVNARISHPVFYVFSEEQEWVKAQFSGLPYDIRYPDTAFPEGGGLSRGLADFYLLSAASHQIISNSSFSWWAAFLNEYPEKLVVCPYEEGNPLWDRDFAASGWITLPFARLPKSSPGTGKE